MTAPGGTTDLAGHRVARIGFGVMQLERCDDDAARAVLRDAIEKGVNHLDTAEFYGAGRCNSLIRSALEPYPESLVLATKVGAVSVPGGKPIPLASAQRPDELRRQVEDNLASLGVERLGVVNLRRLDEQPGIIAEGDQVVPLDDQLAEMLALRDEGKVEGVGLSNVSAQQLRAALSAGVVCVQNGYNLLDRSHAETLDVCRDAGIAWVPFIPLGSAFAGRDKVVDNPVVQEVARRVRATPAQVGLAWLLAEYERTLLIAGTTDRRHLAENIAAGDVVLDDGSMRELRAVAK